MWGCRDYMGLYFIPFLSPQFCGPGAIKRWITVKNTEQAREGLDGDFFFKYFTEKSSSSIPISVQTDDLLNSVYYVPNKANLDLAHSAVRPGWQEVWRVWAAN